MFTIEQAADRLRTSESTVRRLIRSGELPVTRITPGPRGVIRIDPDVLEQYLLSNTMPTTAYADG